MTDANRLAPPMGSLISRARRVRFQFEGTSYIGFDGDTVASALVAHDHWLLSRSFKYHRPRGPLSMAGQDANTLVQLPQEANVLADRIGIAESPVVMGQNYNGSLEKDADAILEKVGRFMPVGFYYRAFYKPKGIWDKWEPIIRKKAGLGVADLDFEPTYHDKAYLFCDVMVVGAGPAGLNAAITAAENGAEVILVDENKQLGGALTYHRFDIDGEMTDEMLNAFRSIVNDHPKIRVMTDAVCNAWFADNYLPVQTGNRMYKIRAKQCIVASGEFEQHVVFRNNDLPGVVLCSAAMRLMKHYAVRPGKKSVVLTGNDDGYLTAIELAEQGVDVVSIVDMRQSPPRKDLGDSVKSLGIPVIPGSTVYEATAKNNHLSAVDVYSINEDYGVEQKVSTIPCDLLCMSAGYMPTYQLLCQAGAQLSYDDKSARFTLKNLPKNLHIAGSVNGIHELDKVIADGQRAAYQCLKKLGLQKQGLSEVTAINIQCDIPTNFPWPIFPHPKGKDFVDFDEDLQSKDIINATRLGYRDIQLVKRFSTVGMGPSQGRHSALPSARLVAMATDRTVSETGVTTARPPFIPEKLAYLAGRIFNPVRKTPMHERHESLGAQFMPAGAWRRPAYYGEASQRNALIQDEASAVRQNVGIIDVSTLGGIEVCGPDAPEFLNRMYTFAFVKQPVGRTRYAVLTNEQGVVIDDGVACRLAEDHYYVTATTSGVDAVYRDMKKWNAQWRLDVDIANVTSAFSAVNVAGPNARKVLEKVCHDVDFSPEAFPYLEYREGHIEEMPVRLMRVGFVGELGYEIHMPTLFALNIWDILMEAGEAFSMRPFGVEAQRLLRLEKGHIIVGQDTDGMSHPGELSLGWAIAKAKPFYVGSRSVDIVMRREQTRKLVGFKLDKSSPKPEEGHLVLDKAGADSSITGNVTSCEYSTTLDAYIGLAFVGIDQQEKGTLIPIRVDGKEVWPEVVPLPFYDPEGERQEVN
ncbi:(2Fe-2S)-binding protein [Grimontia kaedaensis]|uniref:(2Fe-2S)-binding protein n=1 Tax=Grimontia kaedaensis TaxID=2872157 RepID=A0ABY4X1B5_9GAMM|nr:2Fe-2S iron-sulfur cluster-binding protein [Grimontia kaedaensis]USH05007.1 (2Fe-2S)-binding protein [Grimontia kaedaensis]